MSARIRIGTRASPLARVQANEVVRRLAAADPALGAEGALAVEIIHTTGDRMLQGPLSAIGGKGLFTKEIDEALRAGRIDIAVHSMKDMPTRLPEGLAIGAVLPRADPRDALIAADADAGSRGLGGLAEGAAVGTASLRRGALVRHARPDLRVVAFRGNVQTRLRKLADGEGGRDPAGARRTRPARTRPPGARRAGLRYHAARGVPGDHRNRVPRRRCRHARASARHRRPGQRGCRRGGTRLARRARRVVPHAIAALAVPEGEAMSLRAILVRPDGTDLLATERSGGRADATIMGSDAARELRARATPAHFAGA